MATFLEMEDKIKSKPGIAKAVKGFAVIILGAAAISGAFASYQNNRAETIQECVQMTISNAQKSTNAYAETSSIVFSQTLSDSVKPIISDIASKNAEELRSFNPRGFTQEVSQAFHKKQAEKRQFELNQPSEATIKSVVSACEDSNFRDKTSQNAEKIDSALLDVSSGMSNSDLKDKHFDKSGRYGTELKIDKEAILAAKTAKENGQESNMTVKYHSF